MTTDLSARLTSIYGLTDKLKNRVLGPEAAQVATRTVANLALQLRPDDIAAIVFQYRELQETLAQMLASWQLDKVVMEQGIRIALEAGCPEEADRLNDRLSGIVPLWDQIKRALAKSQLSTFREERPFR